MRIAIALLLMVVFAASCKDDKQDNSGRPAETRPAETKPAETKPAATGLGSIAIPNARTATDQILTGGQPTDEHLQQAKDNGVKVVVNLRTKAEESQYATEAAKVESLGMKYVTLPIDGKTGEGMNEENAKKLAELLAEKPVLVHCTSGERVGALFALKAFYVDKYPADAALKVGKDNGLTMPKIEQMVADIMAKAKG
ncbi:MAG TPA: sulfur transferase domain-containing protein [Kofleriaceae bacterium]|nr:sulfur transferase domain-containing protein [Kofleriaceae bacterium]